MRAVRRPARPPANLPAAVHPEHGRQRVPHGHHVSSLLHPWLLIRRAALLRKLAQAKAASEGGGAAPAAAAPQRRTRARSEGPADGGGGRTATANQVEAARCARTARQGPAAGHPPPPGRSAIIKKRDLYQRLGVTRQATDDDLKRAYRKLCVKVHPDKNPAKEAEEAFKLVNKAMEVLSNPDSRRYYDQTGEEASDPRDCRQPAALTPHRRRGSRGVPARGGCRRDSLGALAAPVASAAAASTSTEASKRCTIPLSPATSVANRCAAGDLAAVFWREFWRPAAVSEAAAAPKCPEAGGAGPRGRWRRWQPIFLVRQRCARGPAAARANRSTLKAHHDARAVRWHVHLGLCGGAPEV